MGTNYYWIQPPKGYEGYPEDSIFVHIGKRSAAGAYCWDCMTTLHREGTARVHHGDSLYENPFFENCPSCGKGRSQVKDDHNSGMMELGFQKAAEERPKGVSTCSSFTWTLKKRHKDALIAAKMAVDKAGKPQKVVRDEYSREFTALEFLRMIEANCPIEFESPYEFS